MYRAVLDTCVLVPGLQRHFLLQLATEEAFAPLWSSGTVGELDEVLARIDAKRQRAGSEAYRARLLADMRLAFSGAEICAPRDGAADVVIVAAHPEAGVRVVYAMAERMGQSAQTPHEILRELRDRYGMEDVADMLLPHL